MFRIGPLIVRHGLGSLPRDLRDRAANSVIGSAAAEIAAESVEDFVGRGIGMLVEHRLAGDDEPRRAESALRSVVVDEGLLDRMQLATFHQASTVVIFFPWRLDRQHGARIDDFVVDQYRAGAALGAIADALCAGDVERDRAGRRAT